MLVVQRMVIETEKEDAEIPSISCIPGIVSGHRTLGSPPGSLLSVLSWRPPRFSMTNTIILYIRCYHSRVYTVVSFIATSASLCSHAWRYMKAIGWGNELWLYFGVTKRSCWTLLNGTGIVSNIICKTIAGEIKRISLWTVPQNACWSSHPAFILPSSIRWGLLYPLTGCASVVQWFCF